MAYGLTKSPTQTSSPAFVARSWHFNVGPYSSSLFAKVWFLKLDLHEVFRYVGEVFYAGSFFRNTPGCSSAWLERGASGAKVVG